MAKDTYWFKHDYNARNDDKIMELRSEYGAEGYGAYWMVVETMAESSNGGVKATLIGGLSHGYGVAKGRLSEIIRYCIDIELFYEKDGYYFSKRMLQHKEQRNVLSDLGKKGAETRWGGYRGANGDGNRVAIGGAMAEENREDKKRIDENKEMVDSLWTSHKNSFFNSQDWIYKFCKEKKVSEIIVKKYMKAFISEIELKSDQKETKELQRHFVGWFNLKYKKDEAEIQSHSKTPPLKKLGQQ